MNELALFAGAGGGILAGKLLGWRCICAVEWEPYPACVLAARQNEGLLPPFPIWSDVRTFDGRPWRGLVDVVSGGFPCQDISVAGKGAGIDGERSGMWQHMARIIGEVRPRFAFVENSPALLIRGLDQVLADLAALGYDCRWTVLGAADVGAPHQRDRFWLVAWNADSRDESQVTSVSTASDDTEGVCGAVPDTKRQSLRDQTGEDLEPQKPERPIFGLHDGNSHVADTDLHRPQKRQGERSHRSEEQPPTARTSAMAHTEYGGCEGRHADAWHEQSGSAMPPSGWGTEPNVGRVADGAAHRVDRLKALGNGQVPQCAAQAWRVLTGQEGGDQ